MKSSVRDSELREKPRCFRLSQAVGYLLAVLHFQNFLVTVSDSDLHFAILQSTRCKVRVPAAVSVALASGTSLSDRESSGPVFRFHLRSGAPLWAALSRLSGADLAKKHESCSKRVPCSI